MTIDRRVLFALLAALAANGCPAPDEEEPDEPAPVEPESVTPEPAGGGSYSIHEWGIIDVDLGDHRVEYAAGPGRARPGSTAQASGSNGSGGSGDSNDDDDGDGTTRPNLPQTGQQIVNQGVDTATGVLDALTGGRRGRSGPIAAPRKPVLYFHLDQPTPDFHFDLTVTLGATGTIVEHFPTGALAEHQVTWSQVQLATESCTGGPYPTADSPACESVSDGYCEAAELSGYTSSDAGCLTFAGAQQNFLFYRGESPAPDLPLTIVRNADGTVTVTNASLGTPVGELLRLRRSGDTIQVAQIAIPAVGASVSVGVPATPASDAHRETIRSQLRSIGLTDGEAQAFERAWFGELFDAAAATPHAFPDAVLFFLPADRIDGFAHLEATPAPSATVRAMALRAGWTTL
ncbi:MAG: hypothetical protein R3B82_04430 [Sandaracinaceae bacterium]